jgi:hypothetical protein
MKSEDLRDEFEYFYLELPQADYLNDLDDIPIQDEHIEVNLNDPLCLSDEQVSKLADDSLGLPQILRGDQALMEQELFSEDDESKG